MVNMHAGKPLEILIYGTGAVGSTIGWRLAQNPNTRLSVVCRSNYDAVKQQGIKLTTAMWGNGQFKPHRVVRSPEDVADVPFDYVVCANKVTSSDGLSFIRDLAPAVSHKTALVSAQNGVNVEAPLRTAFRSNTILSAVCYISCAQPLPGIVHQLSAIRPHAFHVGAYDSREGRGARFDDAKLSTFANMDDRFKLVGDIQTERWTKQIFNGAWNPVTAISGLDTHQLLNRSSKYTAIVRSLAEEIYLVATKLGVRLASDLPAKTMEFARQNPPLSPSMLQDARKGKPMEVESLCGNICRQADSIGVQVPTVKAVYQTLLEMNESFIAPPEVIIAIPDLPMIATREVSLPPVMDGPIPLQATC